MEQILQSVVIMAIRLIVVAPKEHSSLSRLYLSAGNTKGGSITVPLTFCLTGLDKSVLQIKPKIFTCHTVDSKSVKQEVNGTVILPPFVFPDQ
jgi:hypothetical protein